MDSRPALAKTESRLPTTVLPGFPGRRETNLLNRGLDVGGARPLKKREERLESEHPIFGDRHNEITLIGLRGDRQGFLDALNSALCTDAEVAA